MTTSVFYQNQESQVIKQPMEEIFKIVAIMPCFPSCDKYSNSQKREDCTKTEMMQYIYSNIKHTEEAKQNKVDGIVVLQFIIEEDGSISNIKAVRSLGSGCDEAAISVVESMNHMPKKWSPGMHQGKAVRVLYTLPIQFKL